MKGPKEEFIRYIRKTGTSLGINIPFEVIEVLNLKGNEIVRVAISKIRKVGRLRAEYVGVRHIRKTGSSLGVNIPFEVVENLKLEENEIVRVLVEKIK